MAQLEAASSSLATEEGDEGKKEGELQLLRESPKDPLQRLDSDT